VNASPSRARRATASWCWTQSTFAARAHLQAEGFRLVTEKHTASARALTGSTGLKL
jgi:hypothetical protein